MGKRLTFSDYLFSLLIIFMLVCIVGAFFYGVQVGKDRSTKKYEVLLQQQQGANHSLEGYHQQYLVSFYHTVFLPYREFQKKWFDTMTDIELKTNTSKPSALIQELGNLADKQYKEIKSISFPNSSPLLVSAHTQYIQSLKLFADKATQLKPGGKTGHELVKFIDEDAYFIEAKQFALQAQHDFYAAVTQWNETLQELPEKELLEQSGLQLPDWNRLNLNLKNRYIAAWLVEHKYYGNYFPQDLVSRIDEMLITGQADKLNLDTISSIAQTLVDTRAVRYGDFLATKSRYYEDELLPQLPFFSVQN